MKAIDFDKTNLHLIHEKSKVERKTANANTATPSDLKADKGPMSQLISLIQASSIEKSNTAHIQSLKTQISEKNYAVDFDELAGRMLAEIDLV